MTYTGVPGRFAVSGDRYRYIRYDDGSEELYDVAADRYEWTNLASDPAHAEALATLRERAPDTFAAKPEVKDDDLPKLTWTPVKSIDEVPASKPDGNPFRVVFRNESEDALELLWIQRNGQPKPEPYATIKPGGRAAQRTRPGAVWLLQTTSAEPRGYFVVDDRAALARVP